MAIAVNTKLQELSDPIDATAFADSSALAVRLQSLFITDAGSDQEKRAGDDNSNDSTLDAHSVVADIFGGANTGLTTAQQRSVAGALYDENLCSVPIRALKASTRNTARVPVRYLAKFSICKYGTCC